MSYFKNYKGTETLVKDGFQVFTSRKIKETVAGFEKDLESVGRLVKNDEVFRTKLGDIKQIQNLNFGLLNEALVDLIGHDQFEVLNNQYFCKPPNYKMTSAHQDNAYFDSSDNVVTFWIPLQDVDLENSCMFYVPKSHTQGLLEHKVIGTNVRTRTGKTGFSLYSDYFDNNEFVKVPMKAGQILVHDKNCMHFSSPNITDNYRLAVTAIIKLI